MLSPADFLAAIACHPGQLRHRRLPGALDECNRFEPIIRSQGSGGPTTRALPRLDFARETPGELDLYQWLIFVGQHEGRHRKQIERTLKSIPE